MKNKFKITFYIIILSNILFGQIYERNLSPIYKSFILPGWGELDLKNEKRSKQFFIQEASIWLSFFGLKYVSNTYESSYKAFAALHASTDLENKPFQYRVDIGDYNTYDEFIDSKRRNRQTDLIWPENLGYEWQWDTESNRKEYDDMRIISGIAKKYSKFAIGAMIANRIISAIDVLYIQNVQNRAKLRSSISNINASSIEYTVYLSF
ncbi:MAG: hypothetical protein CMG07_01045 [Candidatus Marinimicrobia bacterium]|nr:hypothetical protein [Candidatus Neomarinimicrobiota bacterium]